MSFDDKKLISKLMELKQDLFQIAEKKYEEIENLQEDISNLENRMKEIDRLIGIDNIMDAESFLIQNQDEPLKNVEQSRTIFLKTDPKHALVKMKYDGEKLEVNLLDPDRMQLKQQSSMFIEWVLQPLFPLKEKEKEMEVVVDKQNDLGVITKILINNLYKIENVDEIYKVFRALAEHIS